MHFLLHTCGSGTAGAPSSAASASISACSLSCSSIVLGLGGANNATNDRVATGLLSLFFHRLKTPFSHTPMRIS